MYNKNEKRSIKQGKANLISGNVVRGNLATLSLVVLLSACIVIPIQKQDSFAFVVAIGIAITSFISLLFLNKNVFSLKQYSNIQDICLIIVGLGFLLGAVLYHVIGYLAISIVFIILIPALHRIFVMDNKKTLFLSISKSVIMTFTVFVICSILFGPGLNFDQYCSFFENPNALGGVTAIVIPSASYLLLNYRTRLTIKYGMLVYISIAISMCFLSNSRTSFIAIISQLILLTIVTILLKKRESKVDLCWILKNVIISVIILVTIFLLLFFALTIEKTEEPPTLTECLGVGQTRFEKGLDDKDLDTFASGRMGIWKEYIENISILGHEEESRNISNGERSYVNTNAHNAYIQVAYSAGLISGVALALYMLIVGSRLFMSGIRFLVGKTLTFERIYLMMGFFAFLCASITSAGYMPFTYFPATLFWMLSSDIIEKDR